MSWTKRQLIEQAFEEIGLASYVYDLTSEQLRSALRKLDSMMAEWSTKMSLGYPITSTPTASDLDTLSNLPNRANEAVYLNLGIRIAPSFGKVVAPETKALARSAYRALLSFEAMPQEMQFPNTMPAGAGNRSFNNTQPFLDKPDTSPIRNGDNGQLVFSE